MFFNGFTLLLMIVSLIGGIMLGVRIQMAHQEERRHRWIDGETIESQMKRDGWTV